MCVRVCLSSIGVSFFYLCIFVLQCVLCACLCFVYVFLHSVCGFFSCSRVYVLVSLVCVCMCVCVCVYVCVFACIPFVCLGTLRVFCVFICRFVLVFVIFAYVNAHVFTYVNTQYY